MKRELIQRFFLILTADVVIYLILFASFGIFAVMAMGIPSGGENTQSKFILTALVYAVLAVFFLAFVVSGYLISKRTNAKTGTAILTVVLNTLIAVVFPLYVIMLRDHQTRLNRIQRLEKNHTINAKNECDIYQNNQRDNCFYQKALESKSPQICNGISDFLIKEMCIRDVSGELP
jgi:hypothetical protein